VCTCQLCIEPINTLNTINTQLFTKRLFTIDKTLSGQKTFKQAKRTAKVATMRYGTYIIIHSSLAVEELVHQTP